MQVASNANAAVAESVSDLLAELDGISADRVRLNPSPGNATFDDIIEVNANGAMCELVDGTLVEKSKGWMESLVAAYLIELLGGYSRRNNLGLVTGPDGFVRILGSLVRGPDVAFFSWNRLPNRRMPSSSIPECVPDLVVEVLSLGNTLPEMSRKRREYFHAGVKLVWMIDPRQRTVAVYTSITERTVIGETGKLSGVDVLPGLEIELTQLFAELDRVPPA